ncbi:MAG: hypothetical protein J6V01_04555 [Clostridia bacterium]|nr:hypothetical protein [Clostridia bacterium]
MKVFKRILIILAVLFAILAAVAAVSLAVLQKRTDAIKDDISGIYTDEKYRTPVSVQGVDVIKQQVSCGYAVIEMFSSWNGGGITEETLYNEYGKVVTSTGRSFCDEMNKRFTEYVTVIHKYLKNTELIDLVYDSLAGGVPVPFEWAAPYEDVWTLHYSLVIGADIPADKITVANPYGYYEELTVSDFLRRTSFEAYEDMPLFLKLGFAFSVFEKNTVFTVNRVNG